ncbi:MAG: dTMP kinase [Endomicrobiaceae bacterium]|nr:dTMP kinase [Endomicrobiaceae bacterium]MDD3053337.1 dTMP kinase [Endomicrobiaceae bacterium]MDD3922262.1 dTMP kinase [Endomicrobiaceae bacterium]MDD5101729.1 dTMP kinase [Endomicrobiaceae bacterium]
MKSRNGFLITVEGCEGCGKSTQSKLLERYLQKKGLKVVLTREPGGSVVAEQVRNILLNPKSKLSPICELMLYESARAQHVEEIIKPNLQKGYVVICDRFTDSTIAYQGYARKIDIKIIEKLNDIATSLIKPDLTIYLDIKPHIGIKKAKSISTKDSFKDGDRIERENMTFHNAVRKGFIALAKKFPERIKKVKTNSVIEKTQFLVNTEIDKFFTKKKIYV